MRDNIMLAKDYDPDAGTIPGFIPGSMDPDMPIGTRFRKIQSEPNAKHEIGDEGYVISSLGPARCPICNADEEHYGYFVIWDDMQDVPVFISGCKIEKVS